MKKKLLAVVLLVTLLCTFLMAIPVGAATKVLQVNDFTSLAWSDSGGVRYPVKDDTLSVKLYQGAVNTQGNFGVFVLDTENTIAKVLDKNIVLDMQMKIAAIKNDSYVLVTFRDAQAAGDPWSGNKYSLCFESYGGRQAMILRKNNNHIKIGDQLDPTSGADLTAEATKNSIMTDKKYHRVTISAIDDASGNCVIKVFLDGKKYIEYTDKRGVLGVGGVRFCVGEGGELDIKNQTGELPKDAIPSGASIKKLAADAAQAPASTSTAATSSSEPAANSSAAEQAAEVINQETSSANSSAEQATTEASASESSTASESSETAVSSASTSSTDNAAASSAEASASSETGAAEASSDTSDEDKAGTSTTTAIIIAAILVILAGGGTALYFILKKK